MILWSGPFLDISGYGTATRDYVEGLIEAGINIKAYPVKYDRLGSNDKFIGEDIVEYYRKIFIHPVEFCAQNAGQYNHVWHSSPTEVRLSKDAIKNILMTIWETDRVPEFHKSNGSFLNVDRIITASEFSKQAFLATYPDLDVRIVPHVIHDRRAYEPELSEPIKSIVEANTKDKFVFFWNSEWHYGKGYDVMLRGFCETFRGNKEVVLMLKTYSLSSSNYKDDVIRTIKKYKKEYGDEYPKILPLVGNLSYHDVVALYKYSDAYLNTSRREGFSITTAEALGFGLPVIAPDKGGHTEFLNDSNHLPVVSYWDNVTGVEENRAIYKGQKWVEMIYEDFCDQLSYLFYEHENHDPVFAAGIDKTLNKFSSNNVTKTLIKEIQ